MSRKEKFKEGKNFNILKFDGVNQETTFWPQIFVMENGVIFFRIGQSIKFIFCYCNMPCGTLMSVYKYILDNAFECLFVYILIVYILICSISHTHTHSYVAISQKDSQSDPIVTISFWRQNMRPLAKWQRQSVQSFYWSTLSLPPPLSSPALLERACKCDSRPCDHDHVYKVSSPV